MQETKFYRSGKFIYRFRWPIIGIWLLLVACCIPLMPHIISPFKTTGFLDEGSPSAHAEAEMNKKLGYDSKNKILIIYHSSNLSMKDSLFLKKIKNSLSDLKEFPIKHVIIYPDEKHQVSKNKHTAYALVVIKTNKPISDHVLSEFTHLIKTPSDMTIQIGGETLFIDNVSKQTQEDLYKADFVATPVAIITMILVFGSLTSAFLPILLGGASALVILSILYFFGQLFTLSIFTLNIALLLGLCLSLDYALFIIYRFRDELDNGLTTLEAITVTQAQAGKATFFSGLAVFASLSALFLFPINILFSVAVGGMVAVFVALFLALTLLPALLSVLGNKINFLSIFRHKKIQRQKNSAWRWFAQKILKRPFLYFFTILAFLIMLGYPFVHAHFGVSDYRIFPKDSENRAFYNTYTEKFDIKELSPIYILVKTNTDSILSEHNISELYDLTQKLKKNPLIKEVNSIVTVDSKLKKDQYKALYKAPKSSWSPAIKKLLDTTTKKKTTLITITSKYSKNSPQMKKLISNLQHIKKFDGLHLQITGAPVNDQDVLKNIYSNLPYAILWIMISTYFILLLLLRSLFLPLKALIVTLLSLTACYGALVLVFQEGYFSGLIHFDPQNLLDISLLVIIFCALFGFSMDYEVFLLSRIKEAYEQSQDNTKSIVFGIEKSSRIITSAALVVIVLCCSFLVADVLIVKAFGLGIAVAIFVDAFLIRTILVPATMAIFKNWNWYLPRFLQKILPKC